MFPVGVVVHIVSVGASRIIDVNATEYLPGLNDHSLQQTLGVPVVPPKPRKRALSPSRANDFKQCPLLYRFRTIDKLPEPLTSAQAVGVTVHYALENIYSLEKAQRTKEKILSYAQEYWNSTESDYANILGDYSTYATQISQLIDRYLTVEDPQKFDPWHREEFIQTSSELTPLHGFIDRVDRTRDGLIRIVDYKTGKSPRPGYEEKYLFQLKFYAAMYYLRARLIPARLRLIFLGDGTIMEHTPKLDEIEQCIKDIDSLWSMIEQSRITKFFPPRKSRLCDWCSFSSLCPEFGNTPPAYPEN